MSRVVGVGVTFDATDETPSMHLKAGNELSWASYWPEKDWHNQQSHEIFPFIFGVYVLCINTAESKQSCHKGIN